MQFLKMSCAACGYSDQCSKQTRMYVNYCGADRLRVIDRIRRAESECVSRKGHTLTIRTEVLAAAAV